MLLSFQNGCRMFTCDTGSNLNRVTHFYYYKVTETASNCAAAGLPLCASRQCGCLFHTCTAGCSGLCCSTRHEVVPQLLCCALPHGLRCALLMRCAVLCCSASAGLSSAGLCLRCAVLVVNPEPWLCAELCCAVPCVWCVPSHDLRCCATALLY